MNIIGISGLHNSVAFKQREHPNLPSRFYRLAQGFDSAVALVNRQGVQAAAAEERFTGEKGTGAFPVHAIEYCLRAAQLTPDAVDYIAHSFSYEPYRALFERSPSLQRQFAEVYAYAVQARWLEECVPSYHWAEKLVQVPHHVAHAASAFYLSGFSESLILVADAIGELHSTTIALGSGDDITILKEIPAPHSLGILYGLLTLYLGFDMNSDEGKVMGLAPYGNPRRYFRQFMDLIQIGYDGSYTIPLLAENTPEERETYGGSLRILTDMFGPAREPGAPITEHHQDLAAALQAALQACLMQLLQHYRGQTGQSNLCLAGGVALNCVANGVIRQSRLFQDMFVQPAAGDDGTALGAALYVQRQRDPGHAAQRMTMPLWGPGFQRSEIERALVPGQGYTFTLYESFDDLAQEVARRLAEGQVIAWFQDRMEFGPRALGNRSILADPRPGHMRDHINMLIKQREEFRPFAPAVICEAAPEIFEMEAQDARLFAHMLFVTQVRPAYQQQLPAITHVDGSARVQVVTKADHPKFWTLIDAFGACTGMPLLLNTSFNLRGQPIVCTPAEALQTYLASELDALVLENYLVIRAPS